ncbi:MAG: hypothetical protein H6721_23235 [Sandaracinus sp.]|nr:hypothetical protein [Sandaracinus sp.]
MRVRARVGLVGGLVVLSACAADRGGLAGRGGSDGGVPDADVRVDASVDAGGDAGREDAGDGGPIDGGRDTGPVDAGPPPCAVHVSEGGDDGAVGTAVDPLATLDEALSRATSGQVVCVSEGSYDAAAVVSRGVVLRGGYCEGFESEDPVGCVTTLTSSGPEGLVIDADGVVLETFALETGDASGRGNSSVVVRIASGRGIVLRALRLRAGDGSDGENADDGASGDDGGDAPRPARRAVAQTSAPPVARQVTSCGARSAVAVAPAV